MSSYDNFTIVLLKVIAYVRQSIPKIGREEEKKIPAATAKVLKKNKQKNKEEAWVVYLCNGPTSLEGKGREWEVEVIWTPKYS